MTAGVALIISGIAFMVGAVCAATWGSSEYGLFGMYITGCVLFVLGVTAVVYSAGSGKNRRASVPKDGQNRTASAPEAEGPPVQVPVSVPPGVLSNLESSVVASNAQIATQFATGSSLDGQLTGLLGFLATAGTVFVLVKHALDSNRVILLVGVCLAAIMCLRGIFFSKDLEAGPLPSKSFADFGGAEVGFSLQLLSDLTATIVSNDRALGQRRGGLNGVLILLAMAVAVFALVRLWPVVS